MDRLPLELQEKIFNHFLWEKINELYGLRLVSKAWKSVIDEFTTRLFQIWYSRCKAEIPKEHLLDIVQAKYPLLAHPWQKFYWVDSRLPHVAKNAYDIWKGFPNIDDGIYPTKFERNWPFRNSSNIVIGMNDKYYGRTVCLENDSWITEIYQWNDKSYLRKYDLESERIDFYTTEKGTFVVLMGRMNYYISKHPIDNLDLSNELILVGRAGEKYHITQNEVFSVIKNDRVSTQPKILEHGILTECGFQTSAIIEPPARMSEHGDIWQFGRVEICDCTLYIVHVADSPFVTFYPSRKLDRYFGIVKYKISRNSNGKLSFTFEDLTLVNAFQRRCMTHRVRHVSQLCYYNVYPENLCLMNYTLAMDKYRPWLKNAFNENMEALAVHANYVICKEQKPDKKTQICIFQKDNLIECMAANDLDHLKPALRFDFPCETDNVWVGIIYIGLKAQLLVQYDDRKFCRINFY